MQTSVTPVMLDVPAAMSTSKNLDGDKRSSVAQIEVTQLESEPGMLGDVGFEYDPTSWRQTNFEHVAGWFRIKHTACHTIDFGTLREYMLLVPPHPSPAVPRQLLVLPVLPLQFLRLMQHTGPGILVPAVNGIYRRWAMSPDSHHHSGCSSNQRPIPGIGNDGIEHWSLFPLYYCS